MILYLHNGRFIDTDSVGLIEFTDRGGQCAYTDGRTYTMATFYHTPADATARVNSIPTRELRRMHWLSYSAMDSGNGLAERRNREAREHREAKERESDEWLKRHNFAQWQAKHRNDGKEDPGALQRAVDIRYTKMLRKLHEDGHSCKLWSDEDRYDPVYEVRTTWLHSSTMMFDVVNVVIVTTMATMATMATMTTFATQHAETHTHTER